MACRRVICTLLMAVVALAPLASPNVATGADMTPPQMTAFSLTPEQFDTTTQDQTITMTVTLTDGTGVYGAWASIRSVVDTSRSETLTRIEAPRV